MLLINFRIGFYHKFLKNLKEASESFEENFLLFATFAVGNKKNYAKYIEYYKIVWRIKNNAREEAQPHRVIK